MAATNKGQFGNRPDTREQAIAGGRVSSSRQDMSKLGKMGAQAQPTKAKRLGGANSHKNQ